jgi:hypothetical protein
LGNYSVYLVDDPHEDDFYSEIDPRRLRLAEKHFFENGKEVAVESYQDGELISRSESRFNDKGLEVETLEFNGTGSKPFKVVKREFNELGLLTITRQYFDGEESHVEKNVYDSSGRLLRTTVQGEEGEDVTQTFTYKGDCPLPEMHVSNWPPEDVHETRYVNIKVKGEYKVSEEYLTHKKDKYLSRVTKYYWNNELPNDVFEQVFNSKGRLLEECREIVDEKGQTLKRSWHLNSDENCEPHKCSLFEYDDANGISKEEYFENGLRAYINIWKYDAQERLLRKYQGLDPHDSLEIYKYGTEG